MAETAEENDDCEQKACVHRFVLFEMVFQTSPYKEYSLQPGGLVSS